MSLPRTNNIKVFITLIVKLLDNAQEKDQIPAFFTSMDQENVSYIGLNLFDILIIFFHKVNFII